MIAPPLVGRKVRTPKDATPCNTGEGRLYGKCHRDDTTSNNLIRGKGEKSGVRAHKHCREVSALVNPVGSKAK